jgi:hypothetical protein
MQERGGQLVGCVRFFRLYEGIPRGALLDLDSIAWRKRKTFRSILDINIPSREDSKNAQFWTRRFSAVANHFRKHNTPRADLLFVHNHHWIGRVNLIRKCGMHGKSPGDFPIQSDARVSR